MVKWIDSHCHLFDPRFKGECSFILEKAIESGVAHLVSTTTDPEEWLRAEELGSSPLVTIGFGLHPWKVTANYEEQIELLEQKLIQNPRAIVGEVGLDLRSGRPERVLQLRALELQWKLAQKFNRPLSLHSLKAWGEWASIIDRWGEARMQFHAFAASPEVARGLAKRGAWFSVGRGLLRLSSEKAVAIWNALPSDRRMVESDAPDFSPYPNRLHTPADLPELGAAIAHHLSISTEELCAESKKNSERWLAV